MPFDLHHMHLKSYVGPNASAWLFAYQMILFIYLLILKVFSIVLGIRLGFPHPLALSLSHCICGQPLDPMWIHLLSCAHGGERMASHDVM